MPTIKEDVERALSETRERIKQEEYRTKLAAFIAEIQLMWPDIHPDEGITLTQQQFGEYEFDVYSIDCVYPSERSIDVVTSIGRPSDTSNQHPLWEASVEVEIFKDKHERHDSPLVPSRLFLLGRDGMSVFDPEKQSFNKLELDHVDIPDNLQYIAEAIDLVNEVLPG